MHAIANKMAFQANIMNLMFIQSTPVNSANPLNSTIASGYTLLTPYVKSNPKFNTPPTSIENIRLFVGRIKQWWLYLKDNS